MPPFVLPNLYCITHRRRHPQLDPAGAAAAALDGGARLIQLRDDETPPDDLLVLARRLTPLCAEAGARLLLYGDGRAALAAGLHGVQLPAEALADIPRLRKLAPPGFLIGYHARSVKDAWSAAQMGAHLATLGPVYPRPEQPERPALGVQDVALAQARVGVPVYARGGIGPHKFTPLYAAGVRRVALAAAVFDDPDVRGAVARARAFWERERA